MNHKLNQLVRLLNEKLRLFLSISFGIFLFVLFFQPFPLDRFDFNNRLLFVAGFGAIVYVFMLLVRIVFPWAIRLRNPNDIESVPASYLNGFVILALSSVAFAFYLRYVGFVPISFYIMAKVVLICLAPPVALRLYDNVAELGRMNELLMAEIRAMQKQVEKYEEGDINKTLEFYSENNTENLTLAIADIVFVKSADNYVEFVYLEDSQFKKRLIRNTLKNIEFQIKQYSNFIRCHRTYIVNIHYIEKLNRSVTSHWISIKGYQEPIPVSRQYLLKLKDSL